MESAPAFYFFSAVTQDERLQESLSHDNVPLGIDEIADTWFMALSLPVRAIFFRLDVIPKWDRMKS